jgi:hypothetical protein
MSVTGQALDVPSGHVVATLSAGGEVRELFRVEDAVTAQVRSVLPPSPGPAAQAQQAPAETFNTYSDNTVSNTPYTGGYQTTAPSAYYDSQPYVDTAAPVYSYPDAGAYYYPGGAYNDYYPSAFDYPYAYDYPLLFVGGFGFGYGYGNRHYDHDHDHDGYRGYAGGGYHGNLGYAGGGRIDAGGGRIGGGYHPTTYSGPVYRGGASVYSGFHGYQRANGLNGFGGFHPGFAGGGFHGGSGFHGGAMGGHR